MPNPRVRSGRNTDIPVRILIGWTLGLALAGCQSAPGAEPTPTPTPTPGLHRPAPTVAGARAVDIASLYTDRPARLALEASVATASPPDGAPDFQAMAWVSEQGTVLGTVIDGAPECPESLVVAGSGRTLSVPTEHPTIQAAIDAAGAGDIVFVEPGTYHEAVHMHSNISLVGAGAWQTVIDGGGQAVSLIDYTDARNVVVRGFTLSGVGIDPTGCADVNDPFACGGSWYAAAIYGDGHNHEERYFGGDPCADTTILVTQNVIRDNFMGMMSYFHARAVVRNNVFLGNQFGFIANHMQDHALLLNNAFIDNPRFAIASQAAYLDVIGNIVVGSETGVVHEFIQTGRIACNGFAHVGVVGERVTVGEDGNLTFEQAFVDPASGDFRPTPELVAALASCAGQTSDLTPWSLAEPGAFGGVLGLWQ
jgi:hypothetical protein